MHKACKGALLGAAAGAGVAGAKALWSDDDDQVLGRIAKGAAEGAVVGGLVGSLLGWRNCRRQARAAAARRRSPLAGVTAMGEAALPAVQRATDVAGRRAAEAIESARPHVLAAAESAREAAQRAADAARPHVVSAAEAARERAQTFAEATRPHIEALAPGSRAVVAGHDAPVIVAV